MAPCDEEDREAHHRWGGELPQVPVVQTGRVAAVPGPPLPSRTLGELDTWLSTRQGRWPCPLLCPERPGPGHGRLRHTKLALGAGQSWPVPRPCRPGSGPSMVSVAGGQAVPCYSGPKVAALTVGTLLLLTGIGAASWAIGENGPLCLCPPLSPVAPSLPALTSAFSAVMVLLRSDQEPLYPGE